MKRRKCPVLGMVAALLPAMPGCDDDPYAGVGSGRTAPVQPTASAPAEEPAVEATQPVARHGGELIPLPDMSGYVEWLPGTREICFLDGAGEPASKVDMHSLFVGGSSGPQEIPLKPCSSGEAQSPCWMADASAPWDAGAGAVLRGELDGQSFRVLLKPSSPESAPASTRAS